MKILRKLSINLVVCALFAILGVLVCTTPVSAANAHYYASKDLEIAYAGIPADIPITVDSKCDVRITLATSAKQNVTFELLDTSEKVLSSYVFEGEKAQKNFNDGSFDFPEYVIPFSKGGNYIFRFRSDVYVKYKTTIGPTTATISKSSTKVTKGFSTTLKVTNGDVKSWTTSNAKIATVKNGKISAKKVGKATITAKLKDGKKLTCKVTVKDNIYTEKKKTVKDCSAGLWGQVYKAYYSKGKLILKVRIVNNTDVNYNTIGDISVDMYDKNGAVIGKYYGTNKKGTMSAYGIKEFTFTIKKPKKKNADLRLGSAVVGGSLSFN